MSKQSIYKAGVRAAEEQEAGLTVTFVIRSTQPGQELVLPVFADMEVSIGKIVYDEDNVHYLVEVLGENLNVLAGLSEEVPEADLLATVNRLGNAGLNIAIDHDIESEEEPIE